MSVHDVAGALSSPPVPRPRAAERDDVDASAGAAAITTPASARPSALGPWLEPRRSTARAHPRREYWDVTTASWRSRRQVAGGARH